MRKVLAGFVLGVLFALMTFGAVTTFSSVQGRGTYSAGYVVLPRCASEPTTMENGSLCQDLTSGRITYRDSTGLRRLTGVMVP